MSTKIKGAEYPLSKIFSSDFDYEIPSFQRPYATYRNLCIETGMWNRVIGDRATFIPTAPQLELEKKRRESIIELYHQWQERLLDNQVVLSYLGKR